MFQPQALRAQGVRIRWEETATNRLQIGPPNKPAVRHSRPAKRRLLGCEICPSRELADLPSMRRTSQERYPPQTQSVRRRVSPMSTEQTQVPSAPTETVALRLLRHSYSARVQNGLGFGRFGRSLDHKSALRPHTGKQDLHKTLGVRQSRIAKQSVTLLCVLTQGHLVDTRHHVVR